MLSGGEKYRNSFTRYDMVTEIPNAYFVEVGIYKWHGSPTYTLGRWNKQNEKKKLKRITGLPYITIIRGTSFGAALHYRSVPMLFAAIADLVLINIFNRCQDSHHKEIELFRSWGWRSLSKSLNFVALFDFPSNIQDPQWVPRLSFEHHAGS